MRKGTGHPPSYTEYKKMKSLTLHTHGCPRASLRDCSNFSSIKMPIDLGLYQCLLDFIEDRHLVAGQVTGNVFLVAWYFNCNDCN